MTISEALCEKIPDKMSFTDAASMPLVFGTAIHSLINMGRLSKGQVRLHLNPEMMIWDRGFVNGRV